MERTTKRLLRGVTSPSCGVLEYCPLLLFSIRNRNGWLSTTSQTPTEVFFLNSTGHSSVPEWRSSCRTGCLLAWLMCRFFFFSLFRSIYLILFIGKADLESEGETERTWFIPQVASTDRAEPIFRGLPHRCRLARL